MKDDSLIPSPKRAAEVVLGPTHYDPFYITLEKVTDLGTIVNHEITEGYRVEGWSCMMPTAGWTFSFLRTIKNTGEEKLGLFETSLVQSVMLNESTPDWVSFRTRNSTYLLTIDRSRRYDPAALPPPVFGA